MADRPFDLTIDPAVAYQIADLALEFEAEDYGGPGEDDEDTGDEPPSVQARVPATDPIHAELRGLVEALDIDEAHDLLALIWVGRGDFDGRWSAARRRARETEPLHVLSYLEQTPLAAEYIRQALDDLGYPADAYETE